jgi:hypothetical protein
VTEGLAVPFRIALVGLPILEFPQKVEDGNENGDEEN